MIFSLIDLLRRDPRAFIWFVLSLFVALAIAITVHEFSHGLVADRLGDPTPRHSGRLSLNPLAHLDPVGTILLFLVGFGWGKPVPVNPFYLRYGPRSGMALVAVAGAVANLATAALFALPIRLGLIPSLDIIWLIVFYNIILAVFNLIPLPPLDGFNIASGLLPPRFAPSLSVMARYGPVILLMLVAFDMITGIGLLWKGIGPVVNLLGTLLTGKPLL